LRQLKKYGDFTSRVECAVLIAALTAGCSTSTSSSVPSTPPPGPNQNKVVPCSQLRTLRQLNHQLTVFKNARTGDSIEYLVIGDGAASDDLLLMFPGTGQTLAGWPEQMITNAKYSPAIVGTATYKAAENGSVSICHNYRLLLLDYPGVGETPYRRNLTRDAIANDTDAVLENVRRTAGIDTDHVDPLGWSLGTTMAMKYAVLSPISRPARQIHNIVLLATGPGGSEQGDETHDSAACVQTLFNASVQYHGSLDRQIKDKLSELIFPYAGQTPTESGTKSNCTASIDSGKVSLSVTLDCTIDNNCKPYFDSVLISNKTYPWVRTNGIGGRIYREERAIASDWYENYCARAGIGFRSLDCTSYGKVEISETNGGICKTDTSNLDHPIAQDCDHISLAGKINVIVGLEDLFDQWTYGKAVVDGYRQSQGAASARLVIYPHSAGHGLLIQHPKWVQEQIDNAIRQ
jgi:pimeloyl-ACP methyl ester carboxylesterase